jgi:hypothetical protein
MRGVPLWMALTRQLFTFGGWDTYQREVEMLRDQVEHQMPDRWWER